MQNPFMHRTPSLSGPATDILPVTPDDSADLPRYALALYVQTGGALMLDTIEGTHRSVQVADFSLLPIGTRRVRATGTTAQGIHALCI